jgi:hypothetical protein
MEGSLMSQSSLSSGGKTPTEILEIGAVLIGFEYLIQPWERSLAIRSDSMMIKTCAIEYLFL